MSLRHIYMDLWNIKYTWKSLKDLNCLKQIIQRLITCTQLSYNDPYMDWSPYTCGIIALANAY